MLRSKSILYIAVLVILTAFTCESAEAKKARKYNLWGGQLTLNLPAGFKLRAAGEAAYLVIAKTRGSKPSVLTLQIARSLGNAEADWSQTVNGWEMNFQLDPNKRVIVPPAQTGSTFNVEYSDGKGRSSSRAKIRGLYRPRAYDTDFFNVYVVSLTAVPATAWRSPQGRKLLQAFNSVRVRQ